MQDHGLLRYVRTTPDRNFGVGPTPRPFVTLSREAGAGGRSLAEKFVALREGRRDSRENWSVHDRQILADLVADRCPHSVRVAMENEVYHGGGLEGMLRHLLTGEPTESQILIHLEQRIRALASRGHVVIVGRAGSVLTRSLEGGLRVRLHAPRTHRIAWMSASLEVSQEEAARIIDEQDEARARFHRSHFRVDIDDPELYDLIWDTSVLSLDEMARQLSARIDTSAYQLAHRLSA